jgi:hypothetical protein
MRTVLLVAHVGLAIVLFGPVTWAASAFPRHLLPEGLADARALHRVCRLYGPATLAVAAVGAALAQVGGWFAQGWVGASFALFVAGWGLLVGVVLPDQGRAIAALEAGRDATGLRPRLRLAAGAWSALWLVVLVLMIAKPF